MDRSEVGVVEVALTDAGRADPLMRGLPDRLEVLQWHGAEVKRLPPGGGHARQQSDVCDAGVARRRLGLRRPSTTSRSKPTPYATGAACRPIGARSKRPSVSADRPSSSARSRTGSRPFAPARQRLIATSFIWSRPIGGRRGLRIPPDASIGGLPVA